MVEGILFTIFAGLLATGSSLEFRPRVGKLELSTCWSYQCLSSGMGSTCIYPDSSQNTYYLSACDQSKPNSFCDYSDLSDNVTCSRPPTVTSYVSYPGEQCLQDSDCIYGSCISKTCFAGVLNSACTDYLECNPGFRCSNGICTTLLAVGISCSNDYDCVPSAGCNMGICTKYFSLAPGSAVSDCTNGDSYSMFCSDSSCYYNSKSKAGMCIQPFQSTNSTVVCTSYKQCIGTSTNNGTQVYTKTTSCDCGMNTGDTKYCFPQDGDLVAYTFRSAFQQYIASGLLSSCNSARRFEQACFDLNSDTNLYNKFMAAYYEYYYHQELQDASVCTIEIFYPSYLDYSMKIAFVSAFIFFYI